MKRILLGFLLLFSVSQPAFSGVNGAAPASASMSSGAGMLTAAVATNNALNIPLNSLTTASITLICAGTNAFTTTNFFSFYNYTAPSAQVAYSVPSGKSFYALNMWNMTAAVSVGITLGYGTSPPVENGASAPAGYIQYGNTSGTGLMSGFIGGPTASVPAQFSVVGLVFPTGVFPTIRWQTTSNDGHLCIQGIVQ